jgi:hypothetical protein
VTIELLAVLVTASFQSILIVIGLVMLYRLSNKQQADDAALYLQGRRIQEVLREMREELRK